MRKKCQSKQCALNVRYAGNGIACRIKVARASAPKTNPQSGVKYGGNEVEMKMQ